MIPRLQPGKPLGLEGGRKALRFCNSYNRLETLVALWQNSLVEWDEWAILMGEEWESCDNIGPWLDILIEETPIADMIEIPACGRLLMRPEELAALAALPEVVTIYRGCRAINKWGLSWSLDRDIAVRFPSLHRYRGDGPALLITAEIPKRNIIAIKLGGNEQEVIAWKPKHISTRKIRA